MVLINRELDAFLRTVIAAVEPYLDDVVLIGGCGRLARGCKRCSQIRALRDPSQQPGSIGQHAGALEASPDIDEPMIHASVLQMVRSLEAGLGG